MNVNGRAVAAPATASNGILRAAVRPSTGAMVNAAGIRASGANPRKVATICRHKGMRPGMRLETLDSYPTARATPTQNRVTDTRNSKTDRRRALQNASNPIPNEESATMTMDATAVLDMIWVKLAWPFEVF